MSVQATTWVWDHSNSKGNARLVLLAIADAASKEGRNSCQSVSTIAEMCRLGEATVHRKISELVQLGEIHKEGTSGQYGTSVYSLPMMLAPSQNERSQNETPLKTDVTPYQNDPNALSLLIDNPINPNNSKELYPIGAAQAPKAQKRGSRISEDWRPEDDFLEGAKQRFPHLDIGLEAEQFRNFWLSASGANAVKLDWQRAFANWLIKAEKFRRERPARGYGGQSFDGVDELYRKVSQPYAGPSESFDWGSLEA